MIEIKYDDKANAAYIVLGPDVGPGAVRFTYPCDPIDVGGMINLDLESEGRLVGVEVLDARTKLHRTLLEPRNQTSGSVEGDTPSSG